MNGQEPLGATAVTQGTAILKKRLRALGLALLLATALLPGTATAGSESEIRFRWRLASSWAPGVPVLGGAALRYARYLAMLSGGRIDAQVEDPSYHKAPNGVFDMARSGTHEIGLTATHYLRGRELPAQAFAGLTFGMSNADRLAWYYADGGLQRFQAAYAEQGVVPFPLAGGELGAGLWSRRELRGLDDLHGLRLRVPGQATAAFSALGIKPGNAPGAELAEAMRLNRIDACEWPALAENGMAELAAATTYFYPSWRDPAAELVIFVHRAKFEALPDDLQLAVALAAKALATELAGEAVARNRDRITALKDTKVNVRALPKEIARGLQRAHDEALREAATHSPELAEALREREAVLARSGEWARTDP